MALEVCNNGKSAYDKDGNMLSLAEKAAKRARASYKSITGKWPRKDFRPKASGVADPVVLDLEARNFKAWLASLRNKRNAA